MTDTELSVDEIRASLRDWFSTSPGLPEVRANRDRDGDGTAVHRGFDGATWQRLAEQLGVTGLGAPEQWGGLGLDATALAAVVEECAASLYPGPVRASVQLSAALGGIGPDDVPEAVSAAVEAFLGGRVTVGVPTAGTEPPRFADGEVTGAFAAVTHGGVADLILGEVATDDGPAVALVLLSVLHGVDRRERRSVDVVNLLADVDVDGVPAILVVPSQDHAGLESYRRLETILLAAEGVGGAEGALAGMVDYAGVREQFGKLIGTYQAIAHRCADTVIEIAAARALTTAAAAAHESSAHGAGDDAAAGQLALLARAESADAFVEATDAYIQVSGGIGFTWEHDAHLFFRRARATAGIGGTPVQVRDRAVAAGCLDLIERMS